MNDLEQQAEEAEAASDYSRALSLWKRLADSHVSEAYLRRYGRIAQKLSLWDAAQAAFERALEVAPSPFTMELLGSLWTERTDKDAHVCAEYAREWLLKAIAIEKTSRRLVFLGVAHSDLGDRVESEKAFEEALTLDPDNEEAMYNLALQRETTNSNSAASLLERALEIDPDYAAAHQLLGRIHQRTGDFVRAEYHFRRSLEISLDDCWSMLYLANLFAVQGLTEEAISMYEKAISFCPNDLAVRELYSNFLGSIERP